MAATWQEDEVGARGELMPAGVGGGGGLEGGVGDLGDPSSLGEREVLGHGHDEALWGHGILCIPSPIQQSTHFVALLELGDALAHL